MIGDTHVEALKNVSLDIQAGEFIAIMGPSGSGKSTLMNILGLLDVPSQGSYELDGVEISQLTEDELSILRRNKVGFIFQQFHLLSRLNSLENVALPLLYSEKKISFEKSLNLLTQVGLSHRLLNRPTQMSGGQQQRVAIARSLINRPEIIFADEPTGNLDSQSEEEILKILKNLNAQGITVVMVTHEESVAEHANRVIRFKDGVIISDIKKEALLCAAHAHAQPQPQPQPLIIESPKELTKRVDLNSLKQDSLEKLSSSEVFEHFRLGWIQLIENKSRTLLSILGILIGVASVITMMALGSGAQKAIEKQLENLGSNLLVLKASPIRVGGITQDTGSVLRLSLEDVASIRSQIEGVLDVSPYVQKKSQAAFHSQNRMTQMIGVMPSYARIHSMELEMGRFFNEDENRMRSLVAVIGSTVARELFIQQNPIGEMIKINKVNFLVIGVLPEKGSAGWRDLDDLIYIPVNTAMKRMIGKDNIDNIEIEVTHPKEMETASEAIKELMISRHRIPLSQQDNAFEVRNMTDVKAALSESNKTMSLLLAAIATISLIVGGIGVMNIMLVSVTERTKEIGLRKALGARRKDIMIQFLIESVVVSGLGGFFGILLGLISTTLVGFIFGWMTATTGFSIILSFLFSVSIGVGFGIYPAQKASQLNPIEALRHD